jgi:hypothetical protein
VGWSQIVFGYALVALLVILAVTYAWVQIRALRSPHAETPSAESRYERARAWRRLISTGLLLVLAGQLGIALLFLEGPAQQLADQRDARPRPVEPKPDEPRSPEEINFLRIWGGNWVVFLLILLVVLALAGVDLMATRRYALNQRRQLRADQRAMIERQIDQMRAERNGHN